MVATGLVGIVGLSPLGTANARRLAATGLRLVAFDEAPARRDELAAANRLIERAATLHDVGHDCDVVLSTLDGGALATLVRGDDAERPGLGLLMAPGSLLIDMGASAPHDARRLAVLLGSRGIGLVDAPALGAPRDALTGGLVIPTGGFPDFVDRAAPIIERLGRLVPAGVVGSGHTLAALLAARDAAHRHIDAELAAWAAASGIAAAESFTPLAPDDISEARATAIRHAVAAGLAEQHDPAAALRLILDRRPVSTEQPPRPDDAAISRPSAR
jgi:3-hydroxyisobutyrate dehydrogenase